MAERAALLVVAPDGSVRRLEGDAAALAEAVLDHLAVPRTRAEVRAHVEALAGAPLEDASVLDALLALLAASRAIGPAPTTASVPAGDRPRALVALSGGIAAAHAPELVQQLEARGFEVRVIATESALRFASREALEALTHAPVLSGMWARDEAGRETGLVVPHLALAAWADVMIVWPATAAAIQRIASGDTSELVSAVAISTRAPVLVAPSMNEAMAEAPAVRRNTAQLRADGFVIALGHGAHEVADAPGVRALGSGGAPPPAVLAREAQALLRTRVTREAAPRNAAEWEALHRRTPEPELAWFTTHAPEAIVRALATHAPPPGLVWDLGTGHGAIARAAAEAGYTVVATDVAPTALARARASAAGARITFVRDDVTASAIETSFDVIVDRGTLHVLAPDRRAAWAARIEACSRPGTILLVQAHAAADPRLASHPIDRAALEASLPRFTLLAAEPAPFEGTIAPPPEATLFVLRRA